MASEPIIHSISEYDCNITTRIIYWIGLFRLIYYYPLTALTVVYFYSVLTLWQTPTDANLAAVTSNHSQKQRHIDMLFCKDYFTHFTFYTLCPSLISFHIQVPSHLVNIFVYEFNLWFNFQQFFLVNFYPLRYCSSKGLTYFLCTIMQLALFRPLQSVALCQAHCSKKEACHGNISKYNCNLEFKSYWDKLGHTRTNMSMLSGPLSLKLKVDNKERHNFNLHQNTLYEGGHGNPDLVTGWHPVHTLGHWQSARYLHDSKEQNKQIYLCLQPCWIKTKSPLSLTDIYYELKPELAM